MPAAEIQCVKLGKKAPAIDPETPEGDQALRMCLLFGGPELRERVRESVSAEAWSQWADYMLMVVNEYRLDPTSDAANEVLRKHMEAFFFEKAEEIPGYVPPEK